MTVGYQQILGVEPRFRALQRELDSLLQLVDLESNGEVIRPTGFRLKQLARWRSMTVSTPFDAVEPLSGACNCQCVFCFERGHPFPQDRSLLSIEEATTRLRYYDPEEGRALFPANRVGMEMLVNPRALAIYKLAREKSAGQVFQLVTSGAHLTEDVVRQLAELKPILVKLSLNTANPRLRSQLMGRGSRPEVALQAPAHLQRYQIPFIGSVVAWPTVLPDDLVATLTYLDQFEPYALRVRLPTYHRYLHPTPPFSDDLWDRVIELCREIRPRLTSPLFVEPPLYWITPIIPEVDGVIRNSPADAAHLRAGDRVMAVDGEPVYTRSQAAGLLGKAYEQRRSSVKLQVLHAGNGQPRTVELALEAGSYPYSPDAFAPGEHYGVMFLEDFRIKYVDQVCQVMSRHDSRRAMLFTSPVVAPIVRVIVEVLPPFTAFFRDRTLIVEVLEETVMGGNFHLMDGRLVVDFVAQIERAHARLGYLPDLILIPNAFGNPWGMDYFQVSYKEIERRFGVPVELIDWPILYGGTYGNQGS